MKVSTVAEVLKLSKDDTVDAVRGTVDKVFPQKSVGRKGGTLQSVVLKDGRDKITLKLWDREEEISKSWTGAFVHIVAGERGNETESMKVDEYKGDIQLAVPKSAEITKGRDMRESEGDSGDDRRQEKTRSESRSERASQPSGEDDVDDPTVARLNIGKARVFFARCVNLYLLALDAAEYAKAKYKEKHGRDLESEIAKAMTHGFVMTAEKSGLHLLMPKFDVHELLKGGTKTAASTPKETKKERTIQDQLADLIGNAGYTFDQFQAWLLDRGDINTNLLGYVEMPEKLATVMVKHINDVLTELKGFVALGGAK
jgi:hypothetical protein